MDKLYYISQGVSAEEHLLHIERVCKAGGRLAQLRMKSVPTNIFLQTARQAVAICKSYKALLIINDNLEVALQSKADGLHLGKNDISILEARKILGNKIIGGTANTVEDCLLLEQQGADYIGLGPYRYTTTKKNLSPILGLAGYKSILDTLGMNRQIPIYAIGGIREMDFEALLQTGLDGIAVSSLFTKSKSNEINKMINKYTYG